MRAYEREEEEGHGPFRVRDGARAYRLVYILHYAAGERKSIELSRVMHSALPTVPSQDAPDRCFKLKKGGGGEGLQGWETNALTDRRERGA